ncbi:hypothetical protein A3Q56_05850 [Intoshia linei]|uniref:Kinesin motor domain-containing protein n=1 Tax=Intoshia linei TaxID=1819745 RepID=A0A177AWR4_9BILA|nr:hypothetical protein A3Q56_05850 [Intoshia linei]
MNNTYPLVVNLRIRPKTPKEKEKYQNPILTLLNSNNIILNAPQSSNTYKSQRNTKYSHKFSFDNIFDQHCGQHEIFNKFMVDKIELAMKGRNVLVFAYGVTNSGKTYTIQGPPSDPGLIPKAINLIFDKINLIKSDTEGNSNLLKPVRASAIYEQSTEEYFNDLQFKKCLLNDFNKMCKSSIKQLELAFHNLKVSIESRDSIQLGESEKRENSVFGIWITMAEIYNEQVYDLFCLPSADGKIKRQVLNIKEDNTGKTYIKDLNFINIQNSMEAVKLFNLGKSRLKFATTKLNKNSSRSHCMFRIVIVQFDANDNTPIGMNSIVFCDLAGSERINKSETTNLRELGNINTSLLTLQRCISTLRSNQIKNQNMIVPFRESKLTRIFQNYFQEGGSVNILVHISQNDCIFDDTLHCLKYAAVAQEVYIQSFHTNGKSENKSDQSESNTSKNELISMIHNLRKDLYFTIQEKDDLEFELKFENYQKWNIILKDQYEQQKTFHETQQAILESEFEERLELLKSINNPSNDNVKSALENKLLNYQYKLEDKDTEIYKLKKKIEEIQADDVLKQEISFDTRLYQEVSLICKEVESTEKINKRYVLENLTQLSQKIYKLNEKISKYDILYEKFNDSIFSIRKINRHILWLNDYKNRIEKDLKLAVNDSYNANNFKKHLSKMSNISMSVDNVSSVFEDSFTDTLSTVRRSKRIVQNKKFTSESGTIKSRLRSRRKLKPLVSQLFDESPT